MADPQPQDGAESTPIDSEHDAVDPHATTIERQATTERRPLSVGDHSSGAETVPYTGRSAEQHLAPPGDSTTATGPDLAPREGATGTTASASGFDFAGAGAEPPAAGLGTRVGRYLLIEKLGKGSQGQVWNALQVQPIRRNVALKILPDNMAWDEPRAKRLLKEADRGGRLRDPAILPVYEFGEDAGRPFIAMQLVDGLSLADIIKGRAERARDPARKFTHSHWLIDCDDDAYHRAVLALLWRVCGALQTAHEAGIIHRDVKPSNILVDRTRNDCVYLADFGLARDLDDHTATGMTTEPGTLIYMAPERLLGKRKYDQRRAEIFSLGVTLFEAVTLKRPYAIPRDLPRANWPAYLADLEVPRARRLAPGLSRDLEAILYKAMDHAPARRYASAAEVGAEIDRYFAGEPVLARPPSVLRRAARRVFKSTAGRLGIAFVLATGLSVWGFGTARDHAKIAARDDAQRLFQTGELDGAYEKSVAAFAIDPDDEESRSLLAQLEGAALVDARDSSIRAREWRARADRLRRAHGIKQPLLAPLKSNRVEIITHPPGARVYLHAMEFDFSHGRPLPAGAAAHHAEGGSPEQPAVVDGVITGPYWVTAIDPSTNDWAESLLVVGIVPTLSGELFIPRGDPARLSLHLKPSDPLDPSLVPITGGECTLGLDTSAGVEIFAPAYKTHLFDFALGRHEVTNREFLAYLGASGAAIDRARIWPGTVDRPADELLDLPVTNLYHHEAARFAEWLGCRLPFAEEAEWAARGPAGRVQPDKIPKNALRDPAYLKLGPVTALEWDVTRVDEAHVIHGLFANAGEYTFTKFRLPPGHTQRQDHGPNSPIWMGWSLGFGVMRSLRAAGSQAVRELNYLDRASMPGDAFHSEVSFRLARSRRPLIESLGLMGQ